MTPAPSSAPRVIGLVLGASVAFLVAASCETYDPGPAYAGFHQAFALEGTAHATTTCEGCHALAAQQQQLPNELRRGEGFWATKLNQSCASCHPFYAYEPLPLAQCGPGSPAEFSERCLFQTAHPSPPATCEGGGCHSRYDVSFNLDVSPNNPHNAAPLITVFPTAGGHADRACSDCHVAGQEANERGKAQYCASCHTRAEERDAAHYPPARVGWTDDRERDCKACHAVEGANGSLQVADTWGETPKYTHVFLAPHNTVDDWDVEPLVPNAVADWKSDCGSCHEYQQNGTPGVYTSFYCENCHPNDQAFIDLFPAAHQNLLQPCNAEGCHPTGANDE